MGTEHRVCALREIKDGGKKAAKIAGERLVMFRVGEEVFTLQNRCSHLNLPLSPGKFDGSHITCPFHRARFDVRDGKLERKALILGGMGKDCVPTFPTEVRDGAVFVTV